MQLFTAIHRAAKKAALNRRFEFRVANGRQTGLQFCAEQPQKDIDGSPLFDSQEK
jgi:hypothetical protein